MLTYSRPHRYVHGQKVVYSRAHQVPDRQLISVYDFNVHPARVAAAMRPPPTGGVEVVQTEEALLDDPAGPARAFVEVVDWPTVIKRDSQEALQCHPFMEDVESRLPYIETSRLVEARAEPGVHRTASYMMDDERLIELRVRVCLLLRTCAWLTGVITVRSCMGRASRQRTASRCILCKCFDMFLELWMYECWYVCMFLIYSGQSSC